MDSINQFNSNYLNINNPKPAGLVKNVPIEGEVSKNTAPQAQIDTTAISSQALNLYNSQLARIANEMILKYIQSLLNMPDSVEKFIEQLNINKNSETLLNSQAQVVVENMVDISELSKLLNENSKIAFQKILNTITTALNSGLNDTQQLRQIMDVLSSLSQNTANVSYNSIKDLLLLYLPFEIYDFQRTFSSTNIVENQGAYVEPKLTILFETINFSNFSCELQEVENMVSVKFSACKLFPFEKCKKIIELLLSKANIRTIIDNIEKKDTDNTSKNSKQNFRIISSAKVPINVILTAHLVIKTVFKIDKDFSLAI